MIKYENDCVSCDLPCIGSNCPYYCVAHFYCDECREEADDLYWYDDRQLCQDCLMKEIPKVEL